MQQCIVGEIQAVNNSLARNIYLKSLKFDLKVKMRMKFLKIYSNVPTKSQHNLLNMNESKLWNAFIAYCCVAFIVRNRTLTVGIISVLVCDGLVSGQRIVGMAGCRVV